MKTSGDMHIGYVTMIDSQSAAVAERNDSSTSLSLLRWLGIVPAALLAGWLGHRFGSLFHFLRNPAYPEYLFPLLFLVPSGLAFTFVGAIVAPRYRVVTVICLTALCIIQSLCIHILTQPNRGLVNYMHSLGESLGALLGVAAVVWYRVRQSRSEIPTQRSQ